MTRIPTLFAFDRSMAAMNERRATLQDTQQQLATGKRVNSPSDDPLGSAQAERTRSQLARMETEGRMIGFARHMLGQADNAMAGVGEAMQFARENLVGAGNGALGPADRAMIAQQLKTTRDELLALANQRDGAGGFVFGGQGSTSAPFSGSAGAPSAPDFLPNAGEQRTDIDASFTTSQDGRAIFMGTGGAGSSDDIFATLDKAIALLEDPSATGAALTSGLQTAMAGVDSSFDRLLLKRTQVGEQLRAIDGRERLLENGTIEARGRLSDLVEVDYAAAISQFQNNQTGLDAAMMTYAKISRLTLFDYL